MSMSISKTNKRGVRAVKLRRKRKAGEPAEYSFQILLTCVAGSVIQVPGIFW